MVQTETHGIAEFDEPPPVSRNANSVVAYSQQSSAKWRPNTSCADRRAGHDDATKAAKHHIALSGVAAGCFVDPDFPAPTDSICEEATLARRYSRSQSILAGLSRYSSAEDPLERGSQLWCCRERCANGSVRNHHNVAACRRDACCPSAAAGAPYPAFLALAGAALGLLPGTPILTLSPELVLTLFVAPTLLDAAYDASPRDLRDNWRPIVGSSVVAVALTVAAVAGAARWLQPDMPWAVAIVLGAIVAPPDASAATAVLRFLQPPHRVLVILEGESLFNDATALLIYRVGLALAVGTWMGWADVPWLVVSLVGGIALGLTLGKVFPWLVSPIEDGPTAVIVQFVSTFALWILATRLGVSPILTLLFFAMTVARRTPKRMNAHLRLQTNTV